MKPICNAALFTAVVTVTCTSYAQITNTASASNTESVANSNSVQQAGFAAELVGEFEAIPLELVINDAKPVAATVLRTPKGPALSVELIKAARILWTGDTIEHDKTVWLPLAQVTGLSSRFDVNEAILTISVPADKLATQKLERARQAAAAPTAIPALITNYDWNYLSNRSNDNKSSAGFAVFEHTASLGATRLSQSWGVGYQPISSENASKLRYVRSDTTLQYDDPDHLRSWVLGDYLAQSQSWNRSVRMLGASVRRSFAGRPDVLVTPQPSLSGFLVQPSTYELFVNNKRTGSGDLGAGKFEIDQLPLVSGNGDVRIVTKDALGREQVTTVPFSVSPRQLAVGVDDFDVNVGLLRTGLSGKRADYGDLALSAEYARGLTNRWTARASAESSKNQINVGIRNVFGLFDNITATSDLAISNNKEGQLGWLAGLQSGWRGRFTNVSVNLQQRSADFWRLGETTTDRLTLPRHTLAVSFGIAAPDKGSLGVAATHERKFNNETTKSLTATFSKQLSPQTYMHLSASHFAYSTTRSSAINAMFTYAFDDEKTRSFSNASNTSEGFSATVGIERQRTESLPVALRATAQSAGSAGQSGTVGANWQAPAADVDVAYSTNKTANGVAQNTLQMRGSGATTIAAGGVFASRRVHDAAVLIDLNGIANVRAGAAGAAERTNSSGFVLSPYASSYQTVPVAFEPSDMPIEVDYQTTRKFATAWPKSVALVQYELGITPGESLEIIDKQGAAIATGSTTEVAGEQIVIGRNGAMYLPKRPDDGVLLVTTAKGKCTVQLPQLDVARSKTSVLTVTCF